MGQGSINMPNQGQSGINGILAALSAVHLYYGINTEKQKNELQQYQLAAEKRNNDFNSLESQKARAENSASIDFAGKTLGISPEKTKALQDIGSKMTASSLGSDPEKSNLFNLTKGQLAAQASANRFSGIVGIKQDDQSQKVADTFDKNPLISQFSNQAFNIQRGLHTLAGQPTNKIANEVMQDFASAISQGKGSSNYKLQKMETPTLEGFGADTLSFMESNPNQPAPPKVVEYLNKQGGRLLGAYKDELSLQAGQIFKGRKFENNPSAQKVLDDKYNYYKNGGWIGDNEQLLSQSKTASGGSGLLPGNNAEAGSLDPAISDYAKQHSLDYGTANYIINKRKNAPAQ